MADANERLAWLKGRKAALVGRCAILTRTEIAQLLLRHGGTLGRAVTRGTNLVILGQPEEGTADTEHSQFRRSQLSNPALLILTEDEWLARLGLHPASGGPPGYTACQIATLLDEPSPHVLKWIEAGLLRATQVQEGIAFFDYAQLAAARTLCALTRAGVSLRQIQQSEEQLRAWLPQSASSVAESAVLEDNGQVLLRLADGRLAEPTGQVRFDFEHPPEEAAPVRRATESADTWFERGLAFEQAGDLEQAREAYRQALMVGGPDATASYNLGNVLHKLGDLASAAERYRQALEIDPFLESAWNNLGSVCAELGQHKEAVVAFRKALALDQAFAGAHFNLADLLEEMGEPEQAREHWRRYTQLDGASEWGAYARQRVAALSRSSAR